MTSGAAPSDGRSLSEERSGPEGLPPGDSRLTGKLGDEDPSRYDRVIYSNEAQFGLPTSLLLGYARQRFVQKLDRLRDRLPVLDLVADLYLAAFPEIFLKRQGMGNLHHRSIVELDQLAVYVDDFALDLAFALLGRAERMLDGSA